MGKPINENPNPAPHMNAPVVQLNPSSEVAALRERCEKAEAELADLKSPGKIVSQLRAVRDILGVSDCSSRPLHLYVDDVLTRAEKTEAELASAKSLLEAYNRDSIIALAFKDRDAAIARAEKAEARAERLAAYVRMDIEHANHRWNGDRAAVKACALKLRDLMVSLEAHRDLEGGAA